MSDTTPANPSAGALLSEFPPAGYDTWKALVEAELKGAPFERRMVTELVEGIALRPIYRAEDAEGVAHAGSLPGFAPYVRGTRAAGYLDQPWEVSQEIAASSPAEFNDAARAGLGRGLTALNMVLDRATRNGADPDWAEASDVGAGGLSLASLDDLDRALEGIDLESTPLFIRSGASGMPVAALLVALARRRGDDVRCLRGCVEVDPLGVLAHEGRLAQSLSGAYREMASLTAWGAAHAPRLQTICVHSRAWHEAGGHAVQELAFALATALEYARAMAGAGLGIDVVAPRLRFAFTVGSRYFVEIAKLRAARLLWARLVSVLGGGMEAQRATLHVRTAHFNKTAFDPYVNLLRTTVEAFAGVLGGCDSMQVGGFDEVIRSPDEFSQRVARNQQLVLREECHLTRVIDPAGGSWYVEWLTDALARRAWELFQEVEKRGGMAEAMRSGWPQLEVARVAQGRLQAVARRRESVVGTNVYAQVGEKALGAVETDRATFHRRRVREVTDVRTAAEGQHQMVLDRLAGVLGQSEAALFQACSEAVEAGATLGEVTRAVRIEDQLETPITPVCLVRLAEGFERVRRAVEVRAAEGEGRRPAVFLANFGPLKQHKARADFARGFLEAGGFKVISPAGFRTAEEAAAAGDAAGVEAVCLCSTDETYPEWVPAFMAVWRARRPGVPVLLAGHPSEQVEALKAAGVEDFIHLRADALEVLKRLAARLGVAP
ncbi:MAG: acyl-CoA mutase large subunit family protein [Verrucomicrobiae bacterium]|nr:acyl-CoA mutase large subunit family protein [Verrucomicrobiae bacterium]